MFASIGITAIPPITVGLLLPNRMRGFEIASYYLVMSLFGVGIWPVLIPWIASFMAAGPSPFTRSMDIMVWLLGLVTFALCAVATIGLRHTIGTTVSGYVSDGDVSVGQ